MAGTATLIVNNADNELAVFLNGTLVYDKKTEGNPSLNDQVALTGLMKAGDNIMVLVGINWGGPATIAGSVVIGDTKLPFSFTAGSTPNGMCWNETLHLSY